MECNPFNISTGEHESFTFLEIVSFLVALFILILIYIKGNEDKGLLLFPDTSAELSAAHKPLQEHPWAADAHWYVTMCREK